METIIDRDRVTDEFLSFRDFNLVYGLRIDVTATTDPLSAIIQNIEYLKNQVLITHRNSGCFTSSWPIVQSGGKGSFELVEPDTEFAKSPESQCDDVHAVIREALCQNTELAQKIRIRQSVWGKRKSFKDVKKEPCVPWAIERLFKELGRSHPPEKGSDNWILVREVTYEMSFFLRKLKSKVGKAKKEKSTDVIVDGASKFSIKLEQYRGALGIYIIYAIIRPFIEFLARQRLMERCEYTYGFDVTVSELFTFT